MNARAGDFSPVFFSRKRILYMKNLSLKIYHIYSRKIRKEYGDEEMSRIKIYQKDGSAARRK
ncbi:Uncharacterised protein [Anaerostipes hadrus]|uniref:Uncharacterized protein n=1 Tax=Anaerostipes hadrus TaxID=649756 RepID=A0A174JBQ2_ANAHA|nr:Uncharacterised protein [Anaerostipes hadrus]